MFNTEGSNGIGRRKTVIIAIVVAIVIIAIVAVIIGMSSKNGQGNEGPTKSKVDPGQTITQQQIEQGSQSTDGTQPGSSATSPSPNTAAQSTPTTSTFYNQIAQSGRVPADGQGHVSFGILKTQNPMTGWYVVTIKSGNLEPAKVIFRQTNDPNNPLTIVAGPGTYFPDSISLPDAVRKVVGS